MLSIGMNNRINNYVGDDLACKTHKNMIYHIKKTTFIVALHCIAFFLFSCEKEYPGSSVDEDPVANLTKVQEFTDNSYTLSIYTESGAWNLGYTKAYFTLQDKEGKWIEDAVLTSFPEMNMGTMTHSTPHSEITKVQGRPLYEAYYCFLMYSGQGSGTWYMDFSYSVGSITGQFERVEIDVKNVFRPDGKTDRKVIQSLVALDQNQSRYVVTLVEPLHPKVGFNRITAYVHERKDANTFVPVENFTLTLDPRMPSMENHSSPNNVDLTYQKVDQLYTGTVNFSMTGYWRLNLILLNEKEEILYGNPVTNDLETSSLYFEIEF